MIFFPDSFENHELIKFALYNLRPNSIVDSNISGDDLSVDQQSAD